MRQFSSDMFHSQVWHCPAQWHAGGYFCWSIIVYSSFNPTLSVITLIDWNCGTNRTINICKHCRAGHFHCHQLISIFRHTTSLFLISPLLHWSVCLSRVLAPDLKISVMYIIFYFCESCVPDKVIKTLRLYFSSGKLRALPPAPTLTKFITHTEQCG